MIIDTGADYTILPAYLSRQLGIDLRVDCERHRTGGIGGNEYVYLFRGQKVRLGRWNKIIPVGFLGRDDVPPLLGRQNFLEELYVLFEKHKTTFN